MKTLICATYQNRKSVLPCQHVDQQQQHKQSQMLHLHTQYDCLSPDFGQHRVHHAYFALLPQQSVITNSNAIGLQLCNMKFQTAACGINNSNFANYVCKTLIYQHKVNITQYQSTFCVSNLINRSYTMHTFCSIYKCH